MGDLLNRIAEEHRQRYAPLADRLRPQTLNEVVGQSESLAENGFLAKAIRADRIPSLILWGPPGCGKTTLANIVAKLTSSHFEAFSAVLGGVKEIRTIIDQAKSRLHRGIRTLLFVDEIHRFNKSQQDAFLPHVEDGSVTLIGATTENPSFALNAALLSRCKVIVLRSIPESDLIQLCQRALVDTRRGLGELNIQFEEPALAYLASLADGDARRVLNLLEQAAFWCVAHGKTSVDAEIVKAAVGERTLRYDRSGDEHYNVVSAFIKSMRGSDPDAAVYYMCRMLDAGEDPMFVLRRLIIFASEDIGNADPRALQVTVAASQAFAQLGMPEGAIPITQAVTYCATAPKSNASYVALHAAQEDIRRTGTLDVPAHLRNAPTALLRTLGAGRDYVYPHDVAGAFVPNVHYLPDQLAGRHYYEPNGAGYERTIRERLDYWRSTPKKVEP
ncbi:MAG: replication-associated recombination protein A [Myxococcales bacterium]|nr:replication-associated recombination protein A [Myxococcales bacterium]